MAAAKKKAAPGTPLAKVSRVPGQPRKPSDPEDVEPGYLIRVEATARGYHKDIIRNEGERFLFDTNGCRQLAEGEDPKPHRSVYEYEGIRFELPTWVKVLPKNAAGPSTEEEEVHAGHLTTHRDESKYVI